MIRVGDASRPATALSQDFLIGDVGLLKFLRSERRSTSIWRTDQRLRKRQEVFSYLDRFLLSDWRVALPV